MGTRAMAYSEDRWKSSHVRKVTDPRCPALNKSATEKQKNLSTGIYVATDSKGKVRAGSIDQYD